ncbi:MAG: helix-turn-helix transcriptional regulator [Bacteroidota bacterium]|nr:helix-turn-helix transcriptional regulator [Bacteroidota bacterium]MDP4212538.1 helix-turn-helix transcriptional regulator [Bacteroidota bacterium]MDP4250504.1 helix-turn-helix transcriptional regulator [Bacteroidota bacterium]
MPILVTSDIALAKKKMSLTELSLKTGTTLANLSVLKTGKARAMRFSTLELICHHLECQPADILQLITEKEYNRLYPDR